MKRKTHKNTSFCLSWNNICVSCALVLNDVMQYFKKEIKITLINEIENNKWPIFPGYSRHKSCKDGPLRKLTCLFVLKKAFRQAVLGTQKYPVADPSGRHRGPVPPTAPVGRQEKYLIRLTKGINIYLFTIRFCPRYSVGVKRLNT